MLTIMGQSFCPLFTRLSESFSYSDDILSYHLGHFRRFLRILFVQKNLHFPYFVVGNAIERKKSFVMNAFSYVNTFSVLFGLSQRYYQGKRHGTQFFRGFYSRLAWMFRFVSFESEKNL